MNAAGTGVAALLLMLAPAQAAAVDTLFTNAHLIPVSGPEVEGGHVLVEGGRIVAVGPGKGAPGGARVVDLQGRWVSPGLVDTHTHLGVYPLPRVPANADGNEATDPVTPDVRAEDSVDADDPSFDRALMGGVTTVQVLVGSANVVGGRSAVLKIRGRSVESMRLEGAPPGMKLAFGENPKRIYGSRKRLPSTRMGVAAVLRRALVGARAYQEKLERYERRRSRWQAGKSPKDKGEPAPPARDLAKEALVELLEGKIFAHVHCYTRNDILSLLRVFDEFGIKPRSIQHALEAWRAADELARRGIGVAIFNELYAFKWEMTGARTDAPRILFDAGVRTALHTDHPVIDQRWYVHEAAKARRYGLSREEAWRAVTLNPAWILGLDKRIGSLEAGKDADLVVWSDDPFTTRGRVEQVWIEGRLVYDHVNGSLR